MKISKRKITWMSVSCALALLTGLPAIADDTELLLVNPSPGSQPQANVMFILDTSGSMTTELETIAPYDSTTIYPSVGCSPDAVYWTDVDIRPECVGTNDYYIDKDNFFCESASIQMNGIAKEVILIDDDGPGNHCAV